MMERDDIIAKIRDGILNGQIGDYIEEHNIAMDIHDKVIARKCECDSNEVLYVKRSTISTAPNYLYGSSVITYVKLEKNYCPSCGGKIVIKEECDER